MSQTPWVISISTWRDSRLKKRDSFICVTYLIHCVTWLIYMCDVTHSCVWHDSFICAAWRDVTCDFETVTHMNGSCLTHMNGTCLTHMNVSCHTFEWVMSHIWMSHVTRMNGSCHTYEWVKSISHTVSNSRVTSPTWMSYVTHICEWVMSHTYSFEVAVYCSCDVLQLQCVAVWPASSPLWGGFG